MRARDPLPALRQTLAQYDALRALVLDRLEQLICDAEGRIGHLEARAGRLP